MESPEDRKSERKNIYLHHKKASGLTVFPTSGLQKMSIPSLIFWAVFVLPLVAFLVWLMRQEKNKKQALTGLIVLIVMVVVAITYMYLKTGGK
jgi:bacteriorhodopsin